MTDTERLDKLEQFLWSNKNSNGIVIFPSLSSQTGEKHICFQDLGDEDGSGLGEELTELKPNLRQAIDALFI